MFVNLGPVSWAVVIFTAVIFNDKLIVIILIKLFDQNLYFLANYLPLFKWHLFYRTSLEEY